MAEYAVGRGVPEGAILLEDRSTTTEENLRFSKEMVTQRYGPDAAGVAVTSEYHVLRTATLARRLGVDVQVAPAPSAAYYRVSAFLREFVALLAQHPVLHLVLAALVSVPLPALALIAINS